MRKAILFVYIKDTSSYENCMPKVDNDSGSLIVIDTVLR